MPQFGPGSSPTSTGGCQPGLSSGSSGFSASLSNIPRIEKDVRLISAMLHAVLGCSIDGRPGYPANIAALSVTSTSLGPLPPEDAPVRPECSVHGRAEAATGKQEASR